MAEGLGLWLRRAREVRNLTLEDAEKALRIRQRYLKSLEMGDYTALPGEIQARGFLRNYARYLGLPVDEALARYEAEAAGRPMQPRQQTATDSAKGKVLERPTVFAPPPSEHETAQTTAGIPSGLLQILLVIFAIFALIWLAAILFLTFGLDEDASQAPAPAPAATQPLTALPADDTAPVFESSPDGQVYIRLEVEQHAWIRISADNAIVYEDIAAPGQTLQAMGTELVVVATGNGGAFRLYVNGVDWEQLGGQGEVVRRAWSPAGEVPDF